MGHEKTRKQHQKQLIKFITNKLEFHPEKLKSTCRTASDLVLNSTFPV